jgi:hypothetical protein
VFKKLFSRCLATTGGTALRRFIRFRHCLIFVRLPRLNKKATGQHKFSPARIRENSIAVADCPGSGFSCRLR